MTYMRDKAGRRLDTFNVTKSWLAEHRRILLPYSPDTVMAAPPTVTVGGSSTSLTSATAVTAFKSVNINMTSGSTAITIASGTAMFDSGDVGKTIGASSGFNTGTTVASVQSPTAATLSAAATSTNSNRSVTIERASNAFRYRGTTGPIRAGASFPNNGLATAAQPAGISVPDTLAVEFAHYGQKFEIWTLATSGGTSQYRMFVDLGQGWQATTSAPVAGPTGSSLSYILFDFGSVAHRRIRIEMDTSFFFGGVMITGTDTCWSGDAPAPVRAVFAGDSYFEGKYGGNVSRWRAPWGYVAKAMAWGDPYNRGQGGTGYLNNGQSTRATNDILRNRLSEIISLKPDVLVIALGVNDTAYTQSQENTEAAYCFSTLKAALPLCRFYVVGPWNAASLSSTTLAALSTGIQQAATANGMPYMDPQSGSVWASDGTQLVTGTEGWVIGSHTATATNGGAFAHTDDLHATQAGYDYIGRRIVGGIRTIDTYDLAG